MDLVVRLEARQIVPHQSAESGEALAQPIEPSPDRVAKPRLGHVAEAVNAATADWTQTEEASVAEPELHALDLARTDRSEAPPRHLPAVDGRAIAERRLAHGREDAVCADHQVVLATRAVAELH